jgi:hypothetical protein
MTGLERRYRRLLLAYPKAYRAERGGEIVGTLLDAAAPDRRRPAFREAAALIFGGLRVRLGAKQGPRQPIWRDVLHFVAVMALALNTALSVTSLTGGNLRPDTIAGTAATVGALVLVALHRYRLALVLAVFGGLIWEFGISGLTPRWTLAGLITLPAVLTVLAWRRPRDRHTTPAVSTVAAVAIVTPQLLWTALPVPAFHGPGWLAWVLLAPAVLAVAFGLVDPRLTAAYAVNLLLGLTVSATVFIDFGSLGVVTSSDIIAHFVAPLAVALVLLTAGWLVHRRRVRL